MIEEGTTFAKTLQHPFCLNLLLVIFETVVASIPTVETESSHESINSSRQPSCLDCACAKIRDCAIRASLRIRNLANSHQFNADVTARPLTTQEIRLLE